MSRWITRVFSILCILSTTGAICSWTYASFSDSDDWGMFGLVLAVVALISGFTWAFRVDARGEGAWER